MAAHHKPKHFMSGSKVSMEETGYTEFKAHMCLQECEIALWMYEQDSERRSKSPISKTLNAFLNTGTGGTVFLGILDSGEAKGFPMTQFKKDHLMLNVDDLLSQYNPPVEKSRYKIRFVPVVAPNSTPEQIKRTVDYDTSKGVAPEERQRQHMLRNRQFCWCDKDLQARVSSSEMVLPNFVVEIYIKPWNPKFQHRLGEMKTHPIHEDEVGKVYFRRQASLVQYTKQEVIEMTKAELNEYYQPKIDDMTSEIHRLRKELLEKTRAELKENQN